MTAGFAESFFLNIIGYCMIYICAAMCYMPMSDRLKISVRRLLAIAVPVLSVFIIAGSLVSARFSIEQNALAFPVSIIFFVIYHRTLDADVFESLFVFMYVISLSCYPFHYALLIDAAINPAGTHALFPAWVGLLHLLMLAGIAAAFYFFRKQIAEFAENLKQIPLKKIFWTVPCFFTAVLMLLIPINYSTLYAGRMLRLYPIVVTSLFISENLIVYLFGRIAREIMNREKLERENQNLVFQSQRYENLKIHIEQTERIRHDFRQQLRTIKSFAENEKYDSLKDYLADYTESLTDTEWDFFCENSAVDAIAAYYSSMARQYNISTDWRFELPANLPMPESIFCGMLGNLLENSIDACKDLSNIEKTIHLSARMPSLSMLAIVIENPYDGYIITDSKGAIMSRKHEGCGIGLCSIKAATEKYHGCMQIDHDDKSFRISILLNL